MTTPTTAGGAVLPDGHLHDDGYFTWAPGKRPPGRSDHAGWRAEFYLAATIDALRAALQAATDDRDSWCQQASARTEDAVRFAAERDALRAENERWKSTLWAVARELNCLPSVFSDGNAHVLKAAISLRAELASLKAAQDDQARDAARYRKLRRQDWFASPLAVIVNPKDCVKPGSDCPSRDRLDAMIDAIEETP